MNLIKFKRDTSFRNDLFTSESFAHPAKMDAQLLIWIVERFTKEGETILDPMFGSGTTMLACMLGRKVIGVELEQKFIDMAKKNWEKVRQRPQLGSAMGDCQILQGDARNLSGLLADKIITSPPYADAQVPPHTAEGEALRLEIAKERGVSPDKVSYLDYTKKVDKIITSPPYIAQTSASKQTEGLFKGRELFKEGRDPQPHGEGQIGSLPYGSIDSVITSPPYEEAMGEKHHSPIADKIFKEKGLGVYTNKVDHIVTSPPYEDKVPAQDLEFQKRRQSQGNLSLGNVLAKYQSQSADGNIGNLKSSSYLEAMALVYQQCHAVLKSGGLMILITKNFIREQKEVRLDLDTIKLCEQSGFVFQERWYRELPAQSFWRILYHRKYPSVKMITCEDVLIFTKPSS